MAMSDPPADNNVEVYTQEPPGALLRLLATHLPHSLSLLRRLQFTKFPGGVTEHARILYASDAVLPSHPLNGGTMVTTSAMEQQHRPFTAAYLDISRGPETQMWMFSTLERCSSDGSDGSGNEGEEAQRQKALGHAVSVFRAVRRLRDEYAAVPGQKSPLGPCVLVGTMSEALRIALQDEAGVASGNVSPYDKWLLDARGLPPVTEPLDPGMRWGVVRRGDIPLVLSRSDVPRKE